MPARRPSNSIYSFFSFCQKLFLNHWFHSRVQHVLFPEGLAGDAARGDQGVPSKRPGQKTHPTAGESPCWVFPEDVYV